MQDKAEKPADRPGDRSGIDRREPVVIKKYANRRLYNTETSTYVTLDDLAAMVKSDRDFVVYDARTGDDLTHSVLTQIIVEQESRMGGNTMLPIPFLQQLIRFYGGNVQKMVPNYLQMSLASFAKEQERLSKLFPNAFTPAGAIEAFQELARKNMSMFEQTMNMFTSFGQSAGSKGPRAADQSAGDASRASPQSGEAGRSDARKSDELAEMRTQMAQMQAMIEKLSKDRG